MFLLGSSLLSRIPYRFILILNRNKNLSLDTHTKCRFYIKGRLIKLEVQLLEAEAWQVLFSAQQVMRKVEVVYRDIELDYKGKQSAANSVRQQMARAKRDGDLATGKIGILEPMLQEIFQP